MLRLPHALFDTAAEGAAGADAGAGAAAVAMPEGLPAAFWDETSGQVKFSDIGASFEELSALKTQQAERLAGVPETADGYKLELPADFKLPDGVQFEIDANDPAIGQLREFALAEKLPQSVVSKILAIEAGRRASELDAAVKAVTAEEKALGANFPQRKAAAEAFLRTSLTEDQYNGIKSFVTSAKAFEAIETLIEKATAGGGSPGGGGQEPPSTAPKLLKDILYPDQKAS